MNTEKLQVISNVLQVNLLTLGLIITITFWLGFYHSEFWVIYAISMFLAFATAICIGRLNEYIFRLSQSGRHTEASILAGSASNGGFAGETMATQ